MRRYSVLIVDDEVNIVRGLELLIERLLPECQIVGVAYDGKQGCQQALTLRPDIILTDIRMPQTDGIEMIRSLKAAGSVTHFLILSGYAEFEYAKSAISLGVEGYIMKPVEEAELCSVFRKVFVSLNAEDERVKQIRDMKHAVNEYGLKGILEASGERVEKVRLKLSAVDFPMEAEQYLCTIWENNDLNLGEEAFQSCLRTAVERCLEFCSAVSTVLLTEATAAVILVYDKVHDKRVGRAINHMQKCVSELSGMVPGVGVGRCCQRAEQICESFEEARCALNYKVVKGAGCIIRYEEISKMQTNQKLVDARDIKKLEDCIDSMDNRGCREVVDSIFSKIELAEHVSLIDLQILSLNLVLSGIRKMPFMQFQLNTYLGSNILSLESISRFQTVEQLKNWIVNMLNSMNELMLRENLPERRDLIAEIKAYINKNYNKEISLNDIAERFYINPYYLSQLFKKRTGETYQKYLTGIRMNRAKKLLTETELKLYEISALIGYADSNYFSKLFERYVGMKPTEYRNGQTGHDTGKQERNYE